MTLGERLLLARLDAGLSLREVEALSGERITRGGLSLIERGAEHARNPKLSTLETLARVLDVAITVSPGGVTVERRRKR